MRNFFLTLLAVSATVGLFAQPANDDCNGIIDLGVAPYCPDDVFFTNENATASDIGTDNDPGILPDCAGLPPMAHDVWFQFTASDTIDDYTIEVIGLSDNMGSTPMTMPQVAIYRGDCEFDGLQLLGCNAADLGESSIQLDVSGLTPGLPYFLRITDYSNSATPNWGTFKLCVRPKDPVIIIDDNITTDLCSGEVYDSGGPDGDYSPNENFTLTIQPPAPVGCITFTLEYFNIDEASDQIIFYDGPNTSSEQIGILNGLAIVDSLFIGSAGGGGVCYQVQASSGALTIQFISDGDVELDGFHGYWECSEDPCVPYELLQTTVSQDSAEIANALSTTYTQVVVTDINCPDGAMGVFSEGDLTDLGLNKGLLLTSGSVADVANPGATFISQSNFADGDPDLDTLSILDGNALESQDACIIELDVFVNTNELTFEYIFGSEEYPEYVGTQFNDIFALLISGPGIPGVPELNGQENIAVLPPPNSAPVQINSVNNLQNWEYYRNNQIGPSVAYDGLTSDYLGVKKSLTASYQVIPCNTYHLKFAIADRGDGAFDSGVFISEIRGAKPLIAYENQNGISYFAEGCTLLPDLLTFALTQPVEDTVVYDVQITGTATPGIDYVTTVPDQIVFLPGDTLHTYPISVIDDNIVEGEEYVSISLTANFGCGEVILDSLSIAIYDQLQVEILNGADTAYVCPDGSLSISATGAVNYFWSPPSIFDNPSLPNAIVTPPQSMYVYVTGSVGPCTATDSIWLEEVSTVTLGIGTQDPTGICQGDTIFLYASNNVGNTNLSWNPHDGIVSDPDLPGIYVAPQETTTYMASVELEGCSASDSITIFVDTFDPAVANPDTTICQSYPILLANPISPDTSTTNYLWLPPLYIDDPTLAGATANPETNMVYTVISTSEHAYCADTSSIAIEVINADINITQPLQDTINICLGDSVQINSTTSHPGIMWAPETALDDPLSENPLATPTESITYVATLNTGECIAYDSVHIRVDSLPDLTIMVDSLKDVYCEGEQVTLFSTTYEPTHFPDISFQWEPTDAGLLTSDTLFNLVLQLTDTITMTRYVTNKGCADSSSVTLNVIPMKSIEVTPGDTIICPGDSLQLFASIPDADGEITWEWVPNLYINCTDCPDPIVSPDIPLQYTATAKVEGCPAEERSVFVDLHPHPEYSFNTPPIICLGESFELNTVTDPNATYSWLVDSVAFSTEPQPVVTPLETTTYTLIIQYLDCTPIEDEIEVTVVQEPQLTVSEDTSICLGNTVLLTADGVVAGSYFWEPVNENTPTIEVAPSTSGWYVVTFEDAAGCFVSTDSVFVDVGTGFVVDSLYADPDTVFEGQTISLGAFTEPDTLLDPAHLWLLAGSIQVGNMQEITITAPSLDEEEALIYYEVIVTDAYGCTDTARIDVLLKNSRYQIPLVFTPNGDGTNDTFKVYATEGVEVLTFKVFNRWGQLVYDNEDGKAEWDGLQNNQPAPADVYVYIIEIKLGDGQIVVEKNNVTLLR